MKIAFMYPGQGAQKNGMMQDFYEQIGSAPRRRHRAGRNLRTFPR